MSIIDRIVMGDNQFFGVNHLSYERGIDREMRFQNVERVIEVVEWAYELGAGGLMLSTHPRAKHICNAIRESSTLRSDLNIYPNIPYIVKYVRYANEKGIIGLLMDVFSRISMADKMKILLRGGKSILKKDFFDAFKTLIDLEMSYFSGLSVKAVFLHNALVDLAVGLDVEDVLQFFADYVSERYNALPGFGTLNMPATIEKLERSGIEKPLVMASFNKKGLYMNPSRRAYEEWAALDRCALLANGVLASGALGPEEAFEYLFAHAPEASVVIGASTRAHLEESIGYLERILSSVDRQGEKHDGRGR